MSSRIIARVALNALVIAALVGLGLWGHQHGWKLPKFSQLNGVAAKAKSDWCEPHSVPESICVECNPALMPRPQSFGWCEDHGVHECAFCHPELGHSRFPYSPTTADRERVRAALAIERPSNNEKSKAHERRIQFASDIAAKKAGVAEYPAETKPIVESIPVHGEIVNDPGRVAHLSPRAPGSVARVFKHLDDEVAEDDLLALVEASEVGKAKEQFAQACTQVDVKRKDRERLNDASTPATIAAADAALREAKLKFLAARQALINLGLPRSADDFALISEDGIRGIMEAELMDRLHFLGIPDDMQKGLSRERNSNNLLPMRSAGKGRIVSRDIVAGEVVDPSRIVFEVVDSSKVWLTLNVRAEDVAAVVSGKTEVIFMPDGRARKPIKGTIVYRSAQADAATRTVKARAEIENDGTLLANTFGTGQIVLRREPKAIVVPSSAVHFADNSHVVFVQDRNWKNANSYKVYHTREVRIGYRDANVTEIIVGVLPYELVATTGSEVLRAELLKSNFGEGCGCCK